MCLKTFVTTLQTHSQKILANVPTTLRAVQATEVEVKGLSADTPQAGGVGGACRIQRPAAC